MPPSPNPTSMNSASLLRAGWSIEPLPDGGTRIARKRKLDFDTVAITAFATIWNVGLWSLLALERASLDPVSWACAAPFVLFGHALIIAAVRMRWRWGREEWRVDVNRFLLIHRFFGRERVDYFSGGTLRLEASTTDGSPRWDLCVRTEDRFRRLLTVSDDGLGELREVGVLVSHHTGWLLETPSGADTQTQQ